MKDLEYIENNLYLHPPARRIAAFREDRRLRQLLPELYRLEGVPQPPRYHPEGDALTHSLLVVFHLPPAADRILAWAALLHDLGKAETTREIAGRIRAYGHDVRGAEVAGELLDRLDMDQKVRDEVVWLIRHHMFALSWQLPPDRRPSRRQRRLLADPRFPRLLALLELDARASGGWSEKLALVERYRRLAALEARTEGKSSGKH